MSNETTTFLRRCLSYCLICLLTTSLHVNLAIADEPRPGDNNSMSDQELEDSEDDGELVTEPNSSPILTANLLPGFTLREAEVTRGKGPWRDTIWEMWTKPSPTANRPTFIKVSLYPKASRSQALKKAQKAFRVPMDSDQQPAFQRPTWGSFSGQSVGDYCWAYTVAITREVHGPINDSSTLIVVFKGYLFRVQLCGPGDSGLGVDDAFNEQIAKAIVYRLQTWTPP